MHEMPQVQGSQGSTTLGTSPAASSVFWLFMQPVISIAAKEPVLFAHPSLKLTLHRNLICILTCVMTNWIQCTNRIPTWPAREHGCLWPYQTAKVKINKMWKNKQDIKACIHFTKIPSQFIAVLRDYGWCLISSSACGFLHWLYITNINCIEKWLKLYGLKRNMLSLTRALGDKNNICHHLQTSWLKSPSSQRGAGQTVAYSQAAQAAAQPYFNHK